jgi:hypothetical protein
MKCAVKEDLQQECTARWEAYEAAVTESGLSIDARNGMVKAQSIGELMRLVQPPLQSSGMGVDGLVRLRGEHLKASRELSIHLSRHRC